jgi:dihydroorotate dehydrogenase (fumarate)
MARRLEDAGAAAIVMHSLFEESVEAAVDIASPDPRDFPGELDRYLEQMAALKASLEIPVVASLNGVTDAGWLEHAREIQDAGADALELNAYYIARAPWEECEQVEQRHVDLLHHLRETVGIPINVKLSPFFSSIGHMVKRMENAGAAGVALFNRFYQPDIDIDSLRLRNTLHPSTSTDSLLAMRWIAMLHRRVNCSLGATGGIHSGEDAVKLLLAGADVIHLCSALLQHGPEQLTRILGFIETWMARHAFDSIDAIRGRLSQLKINDPSMHERASYIQVLDSYVREQNASI